MTTLRVGARVSTAHFGPGVVVKATKVGALVRLDDFGGVEVEVAAGELRLLAAAEATEEPVASTSAPSASLRGDIAARRAIEALRFGLVPQSAIEALTLGFDDLRDWTLANLPAALGDRPHVAAVTGPFGTGKSHTMAVIRAVASQEGYATARVEVDGQTISLARPETFLRQLWSSLSAPGLDLTTPVFDLYARAIRAGHPAPTILADTAASPGLLDRVAQNYEVMSGLHARGQLDDHAYVLDALLSSSGEFSATDAERQTGVRARKRGGEVQLRRMLGNSVADRAHDLVAVLAGHATVARLAGYRGLIATIDEFEVEQVPSRAGYARVRAHLGVLSDYLRGETAHHPAPLGLFFATIGEDETGEDAAVGPLLAATGGGSYRLESWPPALRRDLAGRIARLYAAAYALDPAFDPALVARVEASLAHGSLDDSGLIRAFIKRYVAALDADYGPPKLATP
ncbi:MAG: BREX system ATP-binding domain-containing protein [Thermomicrobiales bacterium]